MVELLIAYEQREAIDNQIRERILHEQLKTSMTELPVTAMIHARVILGFGVYLENACPYMRECNSRSLDLCINNSYRECPFYRINLAGDILEGKIDFSVASLEVLQN